MPFSINQIEPDTRNVIICLFAFCMSFLPSKANRQVQLPEVPYEMAFADVNFQFSEAARQVFKREAGKVLEAGNREQDLRLLRLYIPVIQPVLSEAGVPQDFAYLMLYNRYQVAVDAAVWTESGVMWCLSKAQARDADLQAGEFLDERKHLVRSAEGAAVTLLRSNVLYHNWGTSLFAQIASRDIINALGVNTTWKQKKYVLIDNAAYGFLLQFLAYKWVMEQELKHYRPSDLEGVYLYPYGKGKSLAYVSAELRIPLNSLVEQNRWIDQKRGIPSENTPVVVIASEEKLREVKMLAELSANVDLPEKELGFPVVVNDQSLEKGHGGSFYKVNEKKGIRGDFCDSPVTLAYKAEISLKSFLGFNEIRESDLIVPGQVYYLEEKAGKGSIPYHVSREGENMWSVSMSYGVKLSELLKFNRMEQDKPLERGRLVWLQERRPRNEDVEYREIKARTYPDTLLEAALLPVNEKLEWISEKEVEEKPEENSAKPQVTEHDKTEIKVAAEVEKPPKAIPAAVVVKPVEKQIIVPELLAEQPSPGFLIHEVRKGETLYRISVNYKVPLNQLYELNRLTSNIIEIGDQIKVKRF